jgi:hypothetical protein
MISKEEIYKIIKAGVQAPSGSNSQPWKFIVKENIIQVIALPEKDHPILNYKNRGTWIAHGALLENMEIAAKNLGIKLNYKIFPYKDDSKIIFEIVLEKSEIKDEDNLYEAIYKRSSNRKKFSNQNLKINEKEFLFKEVSNYSNLILKTTENENEILEIAKNLAWDVYLNLNNEELYKLFIKEIIWDEKEEKIREGRGLYIKTMGLKPQAEKFMKLLKNKFFINLVKKLGLLKVIYKDTINTYSSCGLYGAILTKDNDIDFIYVGKLLENIWLRATKLNLSFHLISGIPFLWQGLNLGNLNIFNEKEKEIINNAYKNLEEIFQSKNLIIALTFRIGYSEPPSVKSFKSEPDIQFI